MKQTAVEWLHNQWANEKEWSWEKIESWFEQAKQMEKEQIIDAWHNGDSDSMYDPKQLRELAEQYYDETYGK